MTGPGGAIWTPPYYGYYLPAHGPIMNVGDQYTTDPVTVVGPPGSINSTYSGNGHQVTISAAPPAPDPAAQDQTTSTITVKGKWGSVNVTHKTTIAGEKSEMSSVWNGITSFFGAIGNAITAAWNDVVGAVSAGIHWLGTELGIAVVSPAGELNGITDASSYRQTSSIGHDPFAHDNLHFH